MCSYEFWGLCFAPIQATSSFFGFKDFIAAIAILVLIYMVVDVRYRFRLQVAPVPLFGIAYALVGVIGFGSLATDVWISEKWLVPQIHFMTTGIWLGVLCVLFLGLVMTWMYYAFIRPPIFGRINYKKYAHALYRVIAKGSESELPVIAHEVLPSAELLVRYAGQAMKKGQHRGAHEGYAHDMLLLIANRKFCRHLVSSSPATAVAFMEEVSKQKAYGVPIGLFARNVATEAILNTDSSLYHEDEGYEAGLLGYIKPFSKALYGNYELIRRLDHNTPLDLHYEVFGSLTARQFETYCRCALITVESFVKGKHWEHQGVISRLLEQMSSAAGRGVTEFQKAPDDWVNDGWRRLREAVHFIKHWVNVIQEHNPRRPTRLRLRGDHNARFRDQDLYDRIAEAMFDILHSAAYVDGPQDRAWTIHHNSTWGEFFDLTTTTESWRIIHFKLRRLLYAEIRELETLPNYKSARVLGLCLNVMGVAQKKRSRGDYGREYRALKIAVLAFVQRNYMRLREEHIDIANACLIGGITFDEAGMRLVKTYAKGLNPEPDREYLPLQPAPAKPAGQAA